MEIKSLSDEAAVYALALVGRTWLEERGVEAYVVVAGAEKRTRESWERVPDWAGGSPQATGDAAEFARKMLSALANGKDDEVSAWTANAIAEATKAKGQIFDPATLAIVGAILIGSILAARVKKVGPVTFYKGVPKELADVMKAASGIPQPPP